MAARPASMASRSSVKEMLVAALFRSRLVTVNSRVTVAPAGTGSSVNDLVREIWSTVTSSTAAALPQESGLKRSPANSSPVVFPREPAAPPTTSTVTVHVAPAPREGADGTNPWLKREIRFVPGIAASTAGEAVLSQSVDALAGSAMTMPAGSTSLNCRELTAAAFAVLSTVSVRMLRLPKGTELGAKLLVNPGRSVATTRSALAGPLLPALEVKSPETFMCVPAVLLVTSTKMVQLPAAPTPPSLKLIEPPPAGALRVPPHNVAAFTGFAITTPAGRLSAKARSDTGDAVWLVMVNRKVATLPGPMVDGTKTLLNEGTGSWAWADTTTTRTVAIATPVSVDRYLFVTVLVMWTPSSQL